jgi:hypothetical protein
LVSSKPGVVLAPTLSERERQRDRENQELKERIKVLEQGWASVVQALTAAGQSIPALGLPPSLTQEKKPLNPSLETGPELTSGIIRAQSPSVTSVTSTPSITFSTLSTSTDDSARHPARMANISDSLTSVPEASLQRAKFSSTRGCSQASNLKTQLSPSQRKQIRKLITGCKTSSSQARTHQQQQRQRLIFQLLLRSIFKSRSRSKG